MPTLVGLSSESVGAERFLGGPQAYYPLLVQQFGLTNQGNLVSSRWTQILVDWVRKVCFPNHSLRLKCDCALK